MSKVSLSGLMRRPARVFYGWWVVAIALIVDTLIQGAFQRGFSVYFLPIQSELGISRAAYSLADLLGRLQGGIQGPIVGYLIDRVGPARLMATGGVLSGLGFILLSFTHSYVYFLLIFVGLLSLASRTGYNNASIPAVNQWFRRKRSLAMSIVYTGQGFGGAFITPAVALMVVGLGWRGSAFISGIVVLAVVVPLSLLVRRSPESMGLLPDGVRAEASPAPPGSARRCGHGAGVEDSGFATTQTSSREESADADFTAMEAMRTSSYWLYVLAVGLRDTVHAGTQWHLVPLMVWSGVSATTAALFVGLTSIIHLILNPCVGWMGDRWPKQRMCASTMVAGALAVVVLMLSSGRLWELAIFAILLAFSETVLPLNWSLLGDFFGRRSFATLAGWYRVPSQIMSMSTPVWVGLVFDRTGSYFWALVPFVILFCLSAFFYWTLPRPKRIRRSSGPPNLDTC